MAGENYRGIWVYAEQQEGRLEPAVFEILAKARQLSAHSCTISAINASIPFLLT